MIDGPLDPVGFRGIAAIVARAHNVAGQRVHEVEDLMSRAAILAQRKGCGRRAAFAVEDRYVGAAKTVDGLLLVADDEELRCGTIAGRVRE